MFEALTAMAFLHFSEKADVEVLEVGLGGRLDTTNVIQPPALKACGITSISLDHTSILGDSLESIANEKAGIIKPGTTVVSAPQSQEAMDVISAVADEKDAELVIVGQDIEVYARLQRPGRSEFHRSRPLKVLRPMDALARRFPDGERRGGCRSLGGGRGTGHGDNRRGH